jgi:hypothetical protein
MLLTIRSVTRERDWVEATALRLVLSCGVELELELLAELFAAFELEAGGGGEMHTISCDDAGLSGGIVSGEEQEQQQQQKG